MKPGKNILRTVVIWLVALAAYNVIVWLLPVEHTSTFIVPYVFTMITFFLPLGVAVLTFGRPTPMKSKFLGYPLFHIAMVVLVLQLIVGLFFMLLAESIGITLAADYPCDPACGRSHWHDIRRCRTGRDSAGGAEWSSRR